MRFRVSDLAQYASCPKRSKLQAFRKVGKPKYGSPLKMGKTMHFEYSCPYKSFDRRLLRYKLKEIGNSFTREIDGHTIAGRPDDYRVLFVTKTVTKIVSIIEVKTTSQKRLWANEKNVAELQLRIYVWLMKPILEKLGYTLHCRHYVEIYSQKDGHLMERITVTTTVGLETTIRNIFDGFKGLRAIRYPPDWVCRKCPRQVKKECWRWKDARKNKIF